MDADIRTQPHVVEIVDQVLHITIDYNRHFYALQHDWAQSIIDTNPGPFRQVRIDMSKCLLVDSSFYAGLMQLHFAYNGDGYHALVLEGPSERLIANLKTLHLFPYFTLES